MGGGGCQGSDCKGCSGKGHSRAKKEREYRGCDGQVNRFYFDFIFYHLLIPKTKQLSTVVSACPEKKKRIQNLFQLDPTNLPESGRTSIYWSVYTGQYVPVQLVF